MVKRYVPPYTCPRCNYETRRKYDINTHFTALKKPCPAICVEQDIELSLDIIEYVFKNRVYSKREANISTTNVPNITINNIQNLIINMNDIDKVKIWLEHQGKQLIGYGNQLEQDHDKVIKKLQNNEYPNGFKIEPESFLQIIDQSVSGSKPENLNMLFNHSLNKIIMYQDDEWESYLTEAGLKKMITRIRDYYLEYYEYFLLRNYFDIHVFAQYRNNCHNQLKEYYKFLAHFDVYPSSYVDLSGEVKKNSEILPNFYQENEYYLSEFCLNLYNYEKKSLKQPDINKMKRQALDIIKCNNLVNIKSLNKKLLNLVNMDLEFKVKLIQQIDSETIEDRTDNDRLVPKSDDLC